MAETYSMAADLLDIEITWQTDEKSDIECDGMAMLTDTDGKAARRYDLVFYNMPAHRSGGLYLKASDRPNETHIRCDLSRIGKDYAAVPILLTVYDAQKRGQDMGLIDAPKVTLFDARTRETLCSHVLTLPREGVCSAQLCRLQKQGKTWVLSAEEQAYADWMPVHFLKDHGLTDWME